MAESHGGFDPATITETQCYARWRPGVDCMSDYTGVIENLKEAGYGKFCDVHMTGYRAFNSEGEGVSWRAWTRDEWEASGREQQHEAAVSGRALRGEGET